MSKVTKHEIGLFQHNLFNITGLSIAAPIMITRRRSRRALGIGTAEMNGWPFRDDQKHHWGQGRQPDGFSSAFMVSIFIKPI